MIKDAAILCVDDDPDSLELLVMWTRLTGCEAIGVAGGEEALIMLASVSFELCITDYRLPDMTGIELCRKARKRWPSLPFILNSADVRQAVYAEAAAVGMHFLAKPTDEEVLHHLVGSLVHCSTGLAA